MTNVIKTTQRLSVDGVCRPAINCVWRVGKWFTSKANI